MKLIPAKINRGLHTKILNLKQQSPTLFFGLGVVGVAAGTVMACQATLKAAPVIEEFQEDVAKVKAEMEDPKDLVYAYWRGSLQIGKLYAPAAGVLTISIASLTGSHIQMRRRNAVLSAAYGTLFTAFERYRETIQEELGEERERDLYLGVEKRTIEDSDGEKQKDVNVLEGATSEYSFLFDEFSKMYRKGDSDNRDFLMVAESYFNDLLRMRGYVFLNEVLNHLGIEPVPSGQIVGWVWETVEGDQHIDFGLYEVYNANFLKGWERSVMLDFNVDGPILEALK